MNSETSIEQLNINQSARIPRNWQLALQDFKAGFSNWRVWLLLSWQDIRLRYRRSQLGPFWLTISMAITIYSMGFLYGHLFKIDLKKYYPFLAAGMLAWNLIYALVAEGTHSLVEAESYLKQIKLPYTTFILRVVCRCLIVFAHNILVMIPIIILFHIHISWSILFLFPALLIIAANGFCYGMLFATFGARYRDVGQIIISLMQVAFFMTPIMWSPDILPGRYQFVTALNPFAQFIELLRAPFTGNLPSLYAITFTVSLFSIGMIFLFVMFAKVRHRIIYWL